LTRLRHRTDLIELIARECEVPAVRRACVTGKAEVLGGFSEILPSTRPGWIVRIIAQRGAVFLVAVVPNEYHHFYQVYVIDEVPWHLWAGKPMAGAPYSIYQGDHPVAYEMRRDLELERLVDA
jgi:hypothetical protein